MKYLYFTTLFLLSLIGCNNLTPIESSKLEELLATKVQNREYEFSEVRVYLLGTEKFQGWNEFSTQKPILVITEQDKIIELFSVMSLGKEDGAKLQFKPDPNNQIKKFIHIIFISNNYKQYAYAKIFLYRNQNDVIGLFQVQNSNGAYPDSRIVSYLVNGLLF